MRKSKVALIGIGGFGTMHVNTIIGLSHEGVLECVAFAEINPTSYREQADKLMAVGAKHYVDYHEMLDHHPEIDFVVIPTPIPLHKPMSIAVMERGFHVLLEKPPAVTIQDVDAMIQTQQQTGRLCAINFQNTSSKAFNLCMQKLNEGRIGKLESVTGVGMWKRTQDYYERTPWAGKLIHNGQYVLDGTINNPLAHLLNNCLIAAGYGHADEAEPRSVQAELYSAHEIEGEDTVCARMETANGVEVRFYTTLCHEGNDTPYIVLEGSGGRMRWSYDNSIVITDHQGEEERISYAADDLVRNMYMNMIEAIHHNDPLYCPVAACRSFMLASNGAFESSEQIYRIPKQHLNIVKENDTTAVYVHGLAQLFQQSIKTGALFSEVGVDWAVRTKPFALQHYREFKLFS